MDILHERALAGQEISCPQCHSWILLAFMKAGIWSAVFFLTSYEASLKTAAAQMIVWTTSISEGGCSAVHPAAEAAVGKSGEDSVLFLSPGKPKRHRCPVDVDFRLLHRGQARHLAFILSSFATAYLHWNPKHEPRAQQQPGADRTNGSGPSLSAWALDNMTVPRISAIRWWLWVGMPLLLGSFLIYLYVPRHVVPIVRNAVEVAVGDTAHNDPARRLVVMQHCAGPVLLMNWSLEQRVGQNWKRVHQATFSGGKLIDPNQGYSFTVTLPVEDTAYRVRVQYGLGLHGLQLWRERVRVAWRTKRFAAALRYNDWEACESVADLVR